MPPGSVVKDLFSHRSSYWAQSLQIVAELPDGTQQSFLMKVPVLVPIGPLWVANGDFEAD